MRRRRWRFYETESGAKPVQAFLDKLSAAEAAEVVAAMKEVAREGLRHDVRVSTLEKYVAALGFQLQLKAVAPKKASSKAERRRRVKK